jgi:hypothetical protein
MPPARPPCSVSTAPVTASSPNRRRASQPAVSADWHFVAFRPLASDLVPGEADTNGQADVFVADLRAGKIGSTGQRGPAGGQADRFLVPISRPSAAASILISRRAASVVRVGRERPRRVTPTALSTSSSTTAEHTTRRISLRGASVEAASSTTCSGTVWELRSRSARRKHVAHVHRRESDPR